MYQQQIQVSREYATLLGYAAYDFAYLEWGIVWIGQKLALGFIDHVKDKTAGCIAADFQSLVSSAGMSDPALSSRLACLATSFRALVVRRNQLMHGTPYTARGGEQRLGYSGKSGDTDWSEDQIIALAQQFEKAAIEANDILHNAMP
jgi:hypothetical protein